MGVFQNNLLAGAAAAASAGGGAFYSHQIEQSVGLMQQIVLGYIELLEHHQAPQQ